MRIHRIVVFLSVIALTVSCGTKKRHAGPVSRVVTLTPSATELVAVLGAADMLVGVDRYSVHPPRVKKLPKVGDFMHPSFEAIITLKPHLVVLDKVQNKLVPKLERAGIRTLVLKMHTIDDVHTGIRELGKAIGRQSKAAELTAKLAADTRAIGKRVALYKGGRPRVLMLLGREVGTLKTMVAAGPGSFMDELIKKLGATNAMSGSPLRYPKISVEQIMRSQPDVILDAVRQHQVAAAKADWAKLDRVPAVTNKRIYPLTDQIFMSPGPRVSEALTRLAKLLYPDL